MKIGAFRNGNLTGFKVWAPLRKNIELYVVHPHEILIPLEKDSGGYWSVVLDDLPETIRYYYRLDNDRDR
ncbi:MAG: Malto-oligosyltrehalose trehalohydrolase, partial [uncultured bacterium]